MSEAVCATESESAKNRFLLGFCLLDVSYSFQKACGRRLDFYDEVAGTLILTLRGFACAAAGDSHSSSFLREFHFVYVGTFEAEILSDYGTVKWTARSDDASRQDCDFLCLYNGVRGREEVWRKVIWVGDVVVEENEKASVKLDGEVVLAYEHQEKHVFWEVESAIANVSYCLGNENHDEGVTGIYVPQESESLRE